MKRALLQRLHNPRNRTCGCDAACWCRRSTVGRAVKWWFPARWFGIHHKGSWPTGGECDEARAWKREQNRRQHPLMCEAQPNYRSIVRLGPLQFGITVRRQDGSVVVHELSGGARLEFGS